MVDTNAADNAIITFTTGVVGANHIKNGQPCQDAHMCLWDRAVVLPNGESLPHGFIAVADGHGDKPYFRSHVGSRFAVLSAADCICDPDVIIRLDQSMNENDSEKFIMQLKKSIINRWNTQVYEHAEAQPFTDDELADVPEKYADRYRNGEQIETAYGSTLIAVLVTDSYLLAMQIGDGNCVIVEGNGDFWQPIPLDEKCVLNVTTSLCDKDAIDVFHHAFQPPNPNSLTAIFIGTDGIDDCFAGAEKLYDFYRVILTSFRDKDEETATTELMDYLPRLSEKGSGDDISIGMMIDKNLLHTIELKKSERNNEGSDSDVGTEENTDNQDGTSQGR